MARSVTFNGITRFKPGGITRVNARNLNQVTLSDNSVIGLIGEADGGAPGNVAGLVALDDPAGAIDLFRDGPLVDAAGLAFQSSNDPDVPGGGSRVYFYKTNQSTQATLSLPTEVPATVFSGVVDSGSTTTLIDAALGSSFEDDELNGSYLVLRPNTATAEVRLITDYESGTQTITVDTLAAAAATADTYLVIQPTLEVTDAVDTGSTTTSIPLKDVTLVADEHIGRWVYIVSGSSTFLRQIVDNSTSALVISPSLPAAPATGSYAIVLSNSIDITSSDWGSHTNGIQVDSSTGSAVDTKVFTTLFEGTSEVSPNIGGNPVLKILYRGGAVNITDSVAANSTKTVINLTGGGLSVNAHSGHQVLINDEYSVIASNTASALTLLYPLTETPSTSDAVVITTVVGGVGQVTGSAGVATGLTVELAGVVGDDLSIAFTAGQTLRDLISVINQNTNYLASGGPGVNLDTTLVADLDYGSFISSVNATSSSLLSVSDSAFTVLASPSVTGSTYSGGARRNAAALVEYLNSFSSRVTATRSTDSVFSGSGTVIDTSDFVSLTGGTRGISANSNFQAGFDKLLTVRVNSVVPLIDQNLSEEGFGSTATLASVAAQLADHVAVSRGVSQMTAGERGGFLGVQGTISQIIAQANSINDMDIAVVGQNPTVLNAQGSLEEFGPRMLAVMAASMRAGVSEIAEPLTHKLIRCSGITQDSSWDPNDLTDANTLIQNGILFAESVDGGGIRWVRDLTTWVTDDNLAFSEGSVRDAVRFVAYELRTGLVERFTGKKAIPATIANVKDTAATILELQRTNNIIVDSTDLATGAVVRAWHNLKVFASGDVLRINVGLFPVVGINFQLNDLFLQLPTQAA